MRTKFLIASVFLAGIALGWAARGTGAVRGSGPLRSDRNRVFVNYPSTEAPSGRKVRALDLWAVRSSGRGSVDFTPFPKGAEGAPVLDDKIWLDDQIWLIELGGTVYIAGPPP